MVKDRHKEFEDRQDAQEERIINEIADGLKISLKDQEGYFFEETSKHLSLDGKNTSNKIRNAIHTVIDTDKHQYVQNTDKYKKYGSFVGTIGSAVDLYVDSLKEKFTEWLSDEEVDFIVTSYLGFLQRKTSLLEQGKIDSEQTDIDNFIDIYKKTIKKEENVAQIKRFLEKLDFSKTKIYQNEVEWRVAENIDKKPIVFPKQEDLSEKERKDLEYIKDELIEIVWSSQYKEFLSDFFYKTKTEEQQNITEIENVIKKLIQEYRIQGNEDTLLIDLYDYLERLRLMLLK